MATTRDTWLLALSLGTLATIALVWLCGWIAAPSRHPELARVVLMARGSEKQLAGASFECRDDPQLGARICATSLSGRTLALTRAADSCKASLAGVPLPCRLDYTLVPGLPSVRIDAPTWTLAPLALTATPHLDYLGTRAECAWGRIAQASGIIVPLAIVAARAAMARRTGPSTRRQWAWRTFAVLASISPLWIAMLWILARWRYVD